MVHWFVANLKKVIADHSQLAKEFRDAAQGISQSKRVLNLREMYADEGVEGLVKEAEFHEAIVRRYESWVTLVEDMVRYGLEEEAVQFYEATTARTGGSHAITMNKWEWTTGGIAHHLEQRMNDSEEQVDELNKIYVTLCATILPALQSEFVDYYEQKRRERPDLKLPEPEYWEE